MKTSPIASLLCRPQRIYQVFGANTDVGKTIFTTLLCKGAKRLWPDKPVTFLKPVSTGPASEADDLCEPWPIVLRFNPLTNSTKINDHVKTFAPDVVTSTLFQYDVPVSPHIAAKAACLATPSDYELLAKCEDFATARAKQGNGWLFLETAGGVHSPTPSGSTQANVYMPLRLPSILIGDSRLGGISQTISAFESLQIRGYDVKSVLLFKDNNYGNLEYLSDYFKNHHTGVETAGLYGPPYRRPDPLEDVDAMKRYYDESANSENLEIVLRHLDQEHKQRITILETMATRAHRTIWWPFTQQSRLSPGDITVIDSACGDHFQTLTPSESRTESIQSTSPDSGPNSLLRPSFDGSASWWTQGLGHSSPRLTLAAAYAAGRYGHVMFAEAIHQPALDLAETLLKGMESPKLSRVFFSDDGSTGTEVAVKMALRATRVRYYNDSIGGSTPRALEVIGFKGGYHGDTMGAMECAEPCAFNEKTEWYSGRGFWFNYPTVLCAHAQWRILMPDDLNDHLGGERLFDSLNDIFDLKARESRGEHLLYEEFILGTLENLYKRGRRFGALIIEPVVLGAGGMALVDPLFQRALVNVVRRSSRLFNDTYTSDSSENDPRDWSGLPVIFDEVFTGLYRLGRFTSCSFLGVHPDISVHAKLLTGGLVPLCTTLASESIFRAFGGNDKTDALLHGHSYTAHPVGCQVALESLAEMSAMDQNGDWDWAKQQGWADSEAINDLGTRNSGVGAHVWSVWPHELVTNLSQRSKSVIGVWALGTVLAIHLADGTATGYSSNVAVILRDDLLRGDRDGHWNVHCRVLGNVLYLMTGLKTPSKEIERVSSLLEQRVGT